MAKSGLRRILIPLILITFFLISLGGAVRAMHAGLSCPDWPLCFGDVIPDVQIQVYYEFIHRVIAGLVSLGVVFFAWKLFSSSEASREAKLTLVFGLLILVTQIILGGLTVLKLLHPSIVTSHLAFGMAFFASLIWCYYNLKDFQLEAKGQMPFKFLALSVFSFLLVFIQIVLGGLVSTNYAGVACPDFPLCNGEFVPTLEGLIGLQVFHRLGAYTVAIALFSLYLVVSKNREQTWMSKSFYNTAGTLVIVVLFQILVGAANVLFRTPPIITVLHLAVAATVLALTLRLIFIARAQSKLS